MSPGDFEVIVIDDGSTDETVEVCNSMKDKMSNLRYFSTGRNLGLEKAQNLGIQSARGEHLLFTDDDCIASREWAETLNAALLRECIVGGAVATSLSNFIKVCHNIAQFHAVMPGRSAGPIEFIAGANMAFRRSVFTQLGCFREDLHCSPDTEMVLRAREQGYTVYFEPRAVVTHDPWRTSFVKIMRYAAYHASATILLRNKYKALLRTPFLLQSPAMLLAASPFIALKVTAGIYSGNSKLAWHCSTIPIVFVLKLAWCWGAARGLRNWNISGEKHEQ
jgi:GT2 family glycosyltransferase